MYIGEIIKTLRLERGISTTRLTHGLCSIQTLRNIENGTEPANKLLLELLIRRLGKSLDKLEIIVSEEIYKLEELRRSCEESIEDGNPEEAERALDAYIKKTKKKSLAHQMFYYRNKAYIAFCISKNIKEAKTLIKKANDISLPGWEDAELNRYLISGMEMENLLAYAKILLVSGGETELYEAQRLLNSCKRYINGFVSDKEEFAKIYPKCAYLLAETYFLEKGIYRSPTDRELFLFNQIGILLSSLGRKKEAEQLYEKILHTMKNSNISIKYRFRMYSTLSANYAKKKCSIELAKENIRLILDCGNFRLLAMNLMIEACALIDDPANFEKCREKIKKVYILCKLLKNEKDLKITKEYYEKKFQEVLE